MTNYDLSINKSCLHLYI